MGSKESHSKTESKVSVESPSKPSPTITNQQPICTEREAQETTTNEDCQNFSSLEDIQFLKKDASKLREIFDEHYKAEIQKKGVTPAWYEKCWRETLKRLLCIKKREWLKLRRDTALELYPIKQQGTSKKVDRASYLNTSYQIEYENYVKELNSTLGLSSEPIDKETTIISQEQKEDHYLLNEFLKTYKLYTDKEALFTEYFDWPQEITLNHIESNLLPKHFQWIVDSIRSKGGTDEKALQSIQNICSSKSSQLVVRIVLASIPQGSYFANLTSWFAARTIPIGLNHMALQVGPYLIHYHKGELVTLHDIGSHDQVFALLYPDSKRLLDIYKDKAIIMKLCENMIAFNSRSYDVFSNNSQHFVLSSLQAMEWKLKWEPKGPILTFIDDIKNSPNGGKINIRDINNKIQGLCSTYEEFLCICKDSPPLVDLLSKKTMGNLNPKEEENLQVLKAIERGYLVQMGKRPSDHTLLFSIENGDRELGYTGDTKFAVTMFVSEKE